MSSQDIKDLVRRYYEEVVSTGDLNRVEAFIGPDYAEVHEGARYPLGIEGAKAHILGVRRTYPDLTLEVTQQVADGSLVVSQVLMRGTHVGEGLGIAPTGKPIVVTAVNIDRVVDGRIVEHGGAANLLEPLLNIGAIRVVWCALDPVSWTSSEGRIRCPEWDQNRHDGHGDSSLRSSKPAPSG